MSAYTKSLIALLGAIGNMLLSPHHYTSPQTIIGYIIAGLVYLAPNVTSSTPPPSSPSSPSSGAAPPPA